MHAVNLPHSLPWNNPLESFSFPLKDDFLETRIILSIFTSPVSNSMPGTQQEFRQWSRGTTRKSFWVWPINGAFSKASRVWVPCSRSQCSTVFWTCLNWIHIYLDLRGNVDVNLPSHWLGAARGRGRGILPTLESWLYCLVAFENLGQIS